MVGMWKNQMLRRKIMWSNASNHHSITRGVNKRSFFLYIILRSNKNKAQQVTLVSSFYEIKIEKKQMI